MADFLEYLLIKADTFHAMSSAPWDCQNIVAIQSNVLNSVSDDVFVLCDKYIFQYNVLPSIRLVKCIHQEYTCIHIGYVYTHEHDFVLAPEPIENGKQILTVVHATCYTAKNAVKNYQYLIMVLRQKVKNSDICEPQGHMIGHWRGNLTQTILKIATKSDQKGTSLELFKPKNIIEAHGGRWAKNNHNWREFTFAFSVPIDN